MDEETIVLVEQFRKGDAQAAQLLFERYVDRLMGLARNRLSAKLNRRIDPDDVVQSAYRSFFTRAKKGEYTLEASGDLWRLLVVITLNKLRGQVEHHTAGKRACGFEQSMPAGSDLPAVELEVLAREPAPDDAVALVELVDGLMAGLDDSQRRMVELRLQGYQIEEIAAEVGRSERGVRRLLDKIKAQLQVQSSISPS